MWLERSRDCHSAKSRRKEVSAFCPLAIFSLRAHRRFRASIFVSRSRFSLLQLRQERTRFHVISGSSARVLVGRGKVVFHPPAGDSLCPIVRGFLPAPVAAMQRFGRDRSNSGHSQRTLKRTLMTRSATSLPNLLRCIRPL